MPTPTALNRTTLVLTPRGQLAVQLARVRGTIAELTAADREWAGDALVLLLAECGATGVANGKGT